MAVRILPDAELLAVTALRADADLAAIVDTRVYTSIPAEPTFPLVRVVRVGGIPEIRQHLDVARLQVDAWGATKFEARTAAATAQAVLHRLVGSHDEGVVTAVVDDLGLSWQPDAETGQPRYTLGVALYIHPNPT